MANEKQTNRAEVVTVSDCENPNRAKMVTRYGGGCGFVRTAKETQIGDFRNRVYRDCEMPKRYGPIQVTFWHKS